MTDNPDPDGPEPGQGSSTDEDAAWREIVANYGPRVHLDGSDLDDFRGPMQHPAWFNASAAADEHADDQEDRFRPGPVPSVGPPRGARGLAWLGVLGTPVAVLLLVMLQVTTPGWAGLLMFLAFVGGFGYLVFTMPRRRDDEDDGAVL